VIENGKASYYANKLDGRITASGQPMDQNALTAASKELPLGSKAQVKNLNTGQTVDVTVNDRGPYVAGRVIDLSKRAADQIGITDGVAPVKVVALVADQPTPELKSKVGKIAASKATARRKKRVEASPPASTPSPPSEAHAADR
jgi:rare lipoprotein A